MSYSPRTPITGLRRWLKMSPQPVMVRCEYSDGRTSALVKIGTSNSRWSEAERAIQALAPSQAFALNNAGEVYRGFTFDEDEKELTDELSSGGVVPEAWPESELAQMAQIFTAAADRAAMRHEKAYSAGFAALKEMYQAQAAQLTDALRRQAATEATLERTRAQLLRLQMELLEPDENTPDTSTMPADVLAAQVIGMAAQKFLQGPTPPGGAPPQANGKGRQ